MPNCFQLIRKTDNQPASLVTVDEELCRHLGVEIHRTLYVGNWYNTIGMGLACGVKLEEIIAEAREQKAGWETEGDEKEVIWWDRRLRIAEYLAENFNVRAWAE